MISMTFPTAGSGFERLFPEQAYRRKAISVWIDDIKDIAIRQKISRVFRVRSKNNSEKVHQFCDCSSGEWQTLVSCEDISEPKRVEAEQSHIRQRLMNIIESLPDCHICPGPGSKSHRLGIKLWRP